MPRQTVRERANTMFLKTREDGSLLEVLNLRQLMDPFARVVEGRLHAGEEIQDPASIAKNELVFPSGEALPLCWLEPDYART
jgi:hypothetical protein